MSATGENLGVRRSLVALQEAYEAGEKEPLEELVRGVKGIKELPSTDERSFFVLGGRDSPHPYKARSSSSLPGNWPFTSDTTTYTATAANSTSLIVWRAVQKNSSRSALRTSMGVRALCGNPTTPPSARAPAHGPFRSPQRFLCMT
jgi:hypothetical protein